MAVSALARAAKARSKLRIVPTRSSSIALALIFTVLLGVSVATLLYFMHVASEAHDHHEVESIIRTDMEGLLDAYRLGGVERVQTIVNYRVDHPVRAAVYAVFYRGAPVAGHVRSDAGADVIWPAYGELMYLPEGMAVHGASKSHKVVAQYSDLGNGYILLVGRDMMQFGADHSFINHLGYTVIALLMLMAAAGFFIGDRVVYRINLIAGTASDIMQTGDLSQRIPVPGQWDDLSKLALILNQLFEQIEALMAGVRQVSDNVAHDLRTPLTRMRNKLATLHDRSEDEQLGLEDDVQALQDDADRLLDTFAALLRISNIESGKWGNEPLCFALDQVVADVIEFYEPLAQNKEQQVLVDLAPVRCCGDKHLLFQAMANIIDNAVKYAPYRGTIRVKLREAPKGSIVCSVTNSGSVVASSDMDKLFRRFYRTDTARTAYQGTGLGLSLVHAVIVQHHGTIEASNVAEGFQITIKMPISYDEIDHDL